jgi:hypothetical protein
MRPAFFLKPCFAHKADPHAGIPPSILPAAPQLLQRIHNTILETVEIMDTDLRRKFRLPIYNALMVFQHK